jgi:hypothetical protein
MPSVLAIFLVFRLSSKSSDPARPLRSDTGARDIDIVHWNSEHWYNAWRGDVSGLTNGGSSRRHWKWVTHTIKCNVTMLSYLAGGAAPAGTATSVEQLHNQIQKMLVEHAYNYIFNWRTMLTAYWICSKSNTRAAPRSPQVPQTRARHLSIRPVWIVAFSVLLV